MPAEPHVETKEDPLQERARDRDGTRGGAPAEVGLDRGLGGQDLTTWNTSAGRAAARSATKASGRLGPHGALLVILGIGVLAAFVLSFLVSRVYDAVTEADGVAALDLPALHAAMSLRSPLTNGVAATVAYVFGPIGMPLMAAVACVLLAVRRRSWTPVILIVAAGIGSLLMTIAGKDIIQRHRPPLADAIPPFEYSPSFPSGHTLNAVVIVGIVAYLLILRRRTAAARAATIVITVVVAVGVGLTRLLLGAHWFTDVLAGWLLGGAWLAVVITAHRLYLTTRHHQARAAVRAGRAAGAEPLDRGPAS